ncbi:MAG: transcriptional repressor [Deltaproteobacteria bacterium]|nr:transcriptional repressor [Deltaproteobacteria bacterium]
MSQVPEGRPVEETELLSRCREAGLKATPQRLAIYRELWTRTDHPTPEDLFNAVRAAQPALSLATVYKTLDTLVGAGLVHEVEHTGDKKRYDANVSPHHHLVCTRCGRIEDFEDSKLSLAPKKSFTRGFIAERVRVQVLGSCARCAKLQGGKRKRRES